MPSIFEGSYFRVSIIFFFRNVLNFECIRNGIFAWAFWYKRARRNILHRKRKNPPSNPGKKVLEALLFNYGGNVEEMAENLNINTDSKTLLSWIEEEGLENLVV